MAASASCPHALHPLGDSIAAAVIAVVNDQVKPCSITGIPGEQHAVRVGYAGVASPCNGPGAVGGMRGTVSDTYLQLPCNTVQLQFNQKAVTPMHSEFH